VRGDNDLDARRPGGGQQLPDVLAQADGLGHFPQARIDLAVRVSLLSDRRHSCTVVTEQQVRVREV
jgi:hypothetical protein